MRIGLFDLELHLLKIIISTFRKILRWLLEFVIILLGVFIILFPISRISFGYEYNIFDTKSKTWCLVWIEVFKIRRFDRLDLGILLNLLLNFYAIFHRHIVIQVALMFSLLFCLFWL